MDQPAAHGNVSGTGPPGAQAPARPAPRRRRARPLPLSAVERTIRTIEKDADTESAAGIARLRSQLHALHLLFIEPVAGYHEHLRTAQDAYNRICEREDELWGKRL